MNCDSTHNWLVLSYFAGIDGMACSQHIDDRLSILSEQGITPILITGICGKPITGIKYSSIPSVGPSGIRFELRHLQRRKPALKFLLALINLFVLPFYLLEKVIIDLDSQWSWFPLAIFKGNSLCRRYKPELVYSTGGPASAHLAAAFIARHNNIPWIAEFQDPLVHQDWLRSKRALKVFTWLERLICQQADAVILLTDKARENADSRTGLGNRGWTVYPGSNPASMPAVSYQKSACCHFAHFGSLGGSRNLKCFLEALQQALSENSSLVESVRLDLYGSCDKLSRSLIENFPFPNVIRDHGRILRQESLIAMKRCDVLLLIQNTEEFSAETIPSKTYEYLHTGRPVLGLVHHNPELSQMLTTLGHTAVAADSSEAVKETIVYCIDRWIQSETRPQPTASPYTIATAVNKLVYIAKSLLFQENTGVNKTE